MIQTDLCCCRKVMYLNALGSLLDENTIRAVDGKGEEVGFCFSCNELRETCMVRHVTHDDSLSKTILQGTLEDGRHSSQQRKTLDGQHGRVDTPVHARTAHNGLLKKRPEEDLC